MYAPGHLGELTQIIDPCLVDAVVAETAAREQRLRLLPARVVVYFVLALAVFEGVSYAGVWAKLTAGLGKVVTVCPCASSLSRARRRLGTAPLHRLFEVLAGPVAPPARRDSFYRGRRLVALDGTTQCVPDDPAVTWCFPKHIGEVKEFGYPMVRLVALVECGTRALLDAAFGSDRIGELSYAHRLLTSLDASMLLLADAYYDAVDFLNAVSGTGAAFLLRSTRKRCPTTRHALPDGSYLTFIRSQHYRAGRGYGRRLEVRIIEAWITVSLEDGTRRTELWRLITSLLDADQYPAQELIEIYHRRWEAETCYFSLKSTILDGRILRSRTVPGIEQELYALLTVYQALIRTADDLVFVHAEVPAHRISFTVLLRAAADTIVTGELPPMTAPVTLVGSIGQAALANLHPPRPRHRLKARMRKRHSKYPFTRHRHPRRCMHYKLHTAIITDGILDKTPPG
ncbi:IS4 family transposase [Streptomyces melanogenes]|uniref:IS4 family transposase n=1 Tax=Streptomyces melanogenes TaxID=67326 RepID=UPI00227D8539|nr:IS4 family transposase [Streptomyces melanogenes]